MTLLGLAIVLGLAAAIAFPNLAEGQGGTGNAGALDTSPAIGSGEKPKVYFTVGVQETSDPLPVATSGDAPLTYTVAGLPDWLTFDQATRTLSGTATVSDGGANYQYQVTDADGDVDTLTIKIAVRPTAAAGLVAETGDQSTSLTWSNPKDAGVTYYEIRNKSANDTDWGSWQSVPVGSLTSSDDGSKLSYRVQNLDESISYKFQIRPVAESASGKKAWGAKSETVETTAIATDTAPALGSGEKPKVYFTLGVAGTSDPLPAATSGDAPLTYSVVGLPDWLTFDQETRTLSGTPSVSDGGADYQYQVTDVDGDVATLTIRFSVKPAAVTGLSAIAGGGSAKLTWTDPKDAGIKHYEIRKKSANDTDWGGWQSVAVGSLTSSDDQSTLSYLVENLTANISYKLQIRPIAESASRKRAWGAKSEAVQTTAIATDTAPALSSDEMPNVYLTVGGEGTSDPLPAATSGNAPLTYSVVGLPDWVTLNQETRTLSGTPSISDGGADYQYQATDVDGDVATLTIRFYVKPAAVTGLSAVVGGGSAWLTWTDPKDAGVTYYEIRKRSVNATDWGTWQSVPVGSLTSSDDQSTFSYLVENLTANISYKLQIRPVAESAGGKKAWGAKSAIVEAANIPPDTAPAFEAGDKPKVHLTVGGTGPSGPLPAATSGNAPLTYSIVGLPDWVTLNQETRKLSGTPSISDGGADYQYQATDVDGDVATLTIRFYVKPAAVTGLSAVVGGGSAWLTWTDPKDAGVTYYEIRKRSVNATDWGTWQSVPVGSLTSSGDRTKLSYRVTNLVEGILYQFQIRPVAESASDKKVWGIKSETVNATPVIFAFNQPTVADQQYTIGTDKTWTTLPDASGGTGALTYSISEDLPDDLDFNATTRQIIGIPTEPQLATAYTYVVTDSTAGTPLRRTMTFNIEVLPARPANIEALPDREGQNLSITLCWDDPADESITRWEWRRAAFETSQDQPQFQDSDWSAWATVSPTVEEGRNCKTDADGMVLSETYVYRIRAISSDEVNNEIVGNHAESLGAAPGTVPPDPIDPIDPTEELRTVHFELSENPIEEVTGRTKLTARIDEEVNTNLKLSFTFGVSQPGFAFSPPTITIPAKSLSGAKVMDIASLLRLTHDPESEFRITLTPDPVANVYFANSKITLVVLPRAG